MDATSSARACSAIRFDQRRLGVGAFEARACLGHGRPSHSREQARRGQQLTIASTSRRLSRNGKSHSDQIELPYS
jgi:hypothetical protein